jgi:hypothetical protein
MQLLSLVVLGGITYGALLLLLFGHRLRLLFKV